MTHPATQQLAATLHKKMGEVSRSEGAHIHYATITATSPLVFDVHESSLVLHEADGDVTLGQGVRAYNAQHGLAIGDTLVLTLMPDGWVAVEVVSPNDGVTNVPRPTVTGSRASGAALADLLTKLDAAGVIHNGTSA